MIRKKKRKHHTLSPPCVVFSPETVAVTQKALKLFELSLRQIDHQSSQIAFAEETMNMVKNKLDTMSATAGHIDLTTFDYNEVIVLATAIQLYTLHLHFFPSTPHCARELQQCRQIAAYFMLHMPNGVKKGKRKYSSVNH